MERAREVGPAAVVERPVQVEAAKGEVVLPQRVPGWRSVAFPLAPGSPWPARLWLSPAG